MRAHARVTERNPVRLSAPAAVRSALRKGLLLVRDGYAGKGLRGETVRWAERLADGEPIDYAKAKDMRGWFARHGVARAESAKRMRDPKSPAAVSWLLWGGDPSIHYRVTGWQDPIAPWLHGVLAQFESKRKGRRAEKNGFREARAYATALDALYPPMNEWVFYGSADSKKALMAAYESLSEQRREAWDAEVRRAFVAHHGDASATMYRRLKGESASATSGLSVTTDDVAGAARFVAVYDVDASDVLAHHAQADTPLASRGFGHEKEVVLKPRNDARLVTIIKNW